MVDTYYGDMGKRYQTQVMKCPRCGGQIKWHCAGSVGIARCLKSIDVSGTWSIEEFKSLRSFCNWSGEVVREKNGRILLVVEQEDENR